MLGDTAGGAALATATHRLHLMSALIGVVLTGAEVDASWGKLCNGGFRLVHSAPDFLSIDGFEAIGQRV